MTILKVLLQLLIETAHENDEFGPVLDFIKERNDKKEFIELVEELVECDSELITEENLSLLDEYLDEFLDIMKQLSFDYSEAFEALEKIADCDSDFEMSGGGGEWRFINNDDIEQIHHDEVTSDTYTLGCFTVWFIADHLNVPTDVIETLQQAEAYEGIGKMILNSDSKAFAKAYADADGYAHHFGSYDGNSYEIGDFEIFRTN